MTEILAKILGQPEDRPALELGENVWSYGQLTRSGAGIAQQLEDWEHGKHRLIALLAARSYTAFSGILAAHLAGLGYAPLHPRFPADRSRAMLDQSGARAIVVGREGLSLLEEVLVPGEEGLLVLGPEIEDFGGLSTAFPGCRFVPRSGIGTAQPMPPMLDSESTAYLLFTSGSTGAPKGVPVSRANLQAYIDFMSGAYPLAPDDRCSQTFDLTFDLSVHDVFMTWTAGACLCPIPEAALLAPARFIRSKGLTIWFSVPSVPMLMTRTRALRPGVFPSLRLSFFCGEPLPVATATAWAAAAPGSRLVNLYGPTEATIAVSSYEWIGDASVRQSRHGLVPLGWIFPTQEGQLLDDDFRAVDGEGSGELCIAGSQITGGYLNRPDKTAEQFVRMPGGDQIWYRTGDRVARGADGCLFFEGRVDYQVKIRGYRVELQEVEAVLREATGADLVVAVTSPPPPAAAEAIIGCIGAPVGTVDQEAVRRYCSQKLPSYMVPQRLIELDKLPLNANGKIDRKAVVALVASQAEGALCGRTI